MLDPTPKTPVNATIFDPNYTLSGETHYSPRKTVDHDSGDSTPPLWRTSPTESPPRRHDRYRSLSPASKAQAIARGQRELMDMVRTMPEGCFELSLRDMVEKPWARPADLNQTHRENLNLIGNLGPKEEIAMKKRSGSGGNGKMARSGSLEAERGGGFLLKMVFPVPTGSAKSKRKKNSSAKSKDSSVKSKVRNNEDKDWWKRKIPILEERQSTKSSSATETSRRSNTSRRSTSTSSSRFEKSIFPSCCSFFRPKKSEGPQHKNRLQEL